MITPLSKKSIPMFSGPNDSYIGGWLLGVISIMGSDACSFWMIDSKVFATILPFPNLS
jgi:hypothetical protein